MQPCQPASAAERAIYKVLCVDDSEEDRLLLRRCLRNQNRFQVVAEVCNGEEAIRYLKGEGAFADRMQFPFPDLMLLDLKMPALTGYEVLEWLQRQSFDQLKVVVLSGSFLPEDKATSLRLGAHAYQVKGSADPAYAAALIKRLEAVVDGDDS